jgi:hypothetical protein
MIKGETVIISSGKRKEKGAIPDRLKNPVLQFFHEVLPKFFNHTDFLC